MAPFWISYMMRMLAWVNLLQNDGLVNRLIGLGGVLPNDIDWLDGRGSVVVIGLVYGYLPYMILPLYVGLDRLPPNALEAARDLGAGRFETFRRVTLPLSRPAIAAAVLLTCLPMLGDYFTVDLLSGSPRTAMVGNLINNTVLTPGQTGQGGAFVLLVLIVSHRADAALRAQRASRGHGVVRALVRWWDNPWRPPRGLQLVTWGYLAWALLPVLIAVLFSFNAGRSRTLWQGFSFRWYWGDQERSVWHDASLHTALTHTLLLGVLTTLITVPLGVAFALGVDRWHGRLPEGSNIVMLLSFVIPETLLAVALLFLVTQLSTPLTLGTSAQVAGLVTFQLSYPVVIVRARLLMIGKQYEQAAIDLGASPMGAIRRVLLPMLAPAILASAVLVFADVIDDFVIVRYLSGDASTEPTSVKIYNTARAAPTPALNALASLMLFASLMAVLTGLVVYRWLSRGEKDASSIESFAGGL